MRTEEEEFDKELRLLESGCEGVDVKSTLGVRFGRSVEAKSEKYKSMKKIVEKEVVRRDWAQKKLAEHRVDHQLPGVRNEAGPVLASQFDLLGGGPARCRGGRTRRRSERAYGMPPCVLAWAGNGFSGTM